MTATTPYQIIAMALKVGGFISIHYQNAEQLDMGAIIGSSGKWTGTNDRLFSYSYYYFIKNLFPVHFTSGVDRSGDHKSTELSLAVANCASDL